MTFMEIGDYDVMFISSHRRNLIYLSGFIPNIDIYFLNSVRRFKLNIIQFLYSLCSEDYTCVN